MWYFKTTTIDAADSQLIENSVRQFAAKRNTSLDFLSSDYAGNTKLFLGVENEKELYITRIRTPFERLLPKLILKFDKLHGYTHYQVRLSLLSFIVILLLLISLLVNIGYVILENSFSKDLIFLPIFLLVFLSFVYLEYHFTKARLMTAIKKTEEIALTFN